MSPKPPPTTKELEQKLLRLRFAVREELGELGERLHLIAHWTAEGGPDTLRKVGAELRRLARRVFDFREGFKRGDGDA